MAKDISQLVPTLRKKMEQADKSSFEMNLPKFDFSKVNYKINAVDLDQNGFEAAFQKEHEKAVIEIGRQLEGYLKQLMQASWDWDDGKRDIIDTGELMRSGGVLVSGDDISVAYDSPYAGLVHYGGYITPYGNPSAARVYLPGRPWIAAAFGLAPGPLPKFDMEGAYLRYMDGITIA